MTDKLLSMIKERFPLKEKNVGAFASLKANGMKFTVSAYEAEGLGHVSVMTAKGFFGLMKMDTLIVNPKTLDLPLYSYDRILAMGNDTLIVELYDTMVEPLDTEALKAVNEANKDLPERDPGTHWYDGIKLKESVSKKGKKLTERFDAYTKDYTCAYLGLPAKPVTDAAAKREKANAYVEGLLKNGGPSTDVFKKALGEQKTAELFRKVLFGTEE
ncbi:MAG: hypothetical protein IKD54_03765 [Clostridia bacterium]|nr:hypothetical protein [Clostridia bacterium]